MKRVVLILISLIIFTFSVGSLNATAEEGPPIPKDGDIPAELTAEEWRRIRQQLPIPIEEAKLSASDAQEADWFGFSVAVDSDTIVVGATDEDGGPGDPLNKAGAAYVFARNQGGTNNWGEVTKLTASDAQAIDFFGRSVSINGDTIVVGAWAEDGGSGDPLDGAGAAYVFARDQGGTNNWGEVTKLTPSDAQAGDWFGYSVAVDGDTVVVGAISEDGGPGDPLSGAGAAYVFARDQGGTNNWGELKKLTASDAQASDEFGLSVAINGDTVVVGAIREAGGSGDPLAAAGAAYVFDRDQGGTDNWGELKKLTASDAQTFDFFGISVALDGDTVVVGASGEAGGPGDPLFDAGAAYLFERDQGGTNNWGEVTKLTASDTQEGDDFGSFVAIRGDAIVVGATGEAGGPGDPLNSAGAAYVFARNQGGTNNWGEVTKLTASDAQAFDDFGRVAVNRAGVIIVGATGEDGGPGDPRPQSGAAYVICVDDDLEDNDSFGGALPVLPGSYSDLQVCGGDDDYYSFVASAGNTVDLSAFFAHAGGDLDLALYNENEVQVALSDTVTDDENITYVVPATGTYFVRVYGWLGALNHYDLELSNGCLDDGLEDNDTFGQATGMPPFSYDNLQICSGDDDYFSFNLGAGDMVDITTEFFHADGDIDMALYDENQVQVAISQSTSDDEFISHVAQANGTYYLRVYGFLGAENEYDLTVSVNEACTDDGLEENDNFGQATGMPPFSYDNLQICSGDDDYFSVALEAGETIEITTEFTHADGDLDLELYNPNQTVGAGSSSLTDNEFISYVAPTAGTYYIRVYGLQLAENEYDLQVTITQSNSFIYLPIMNR